MREAEARKRQGGELNPWLLAGGAGVLGGLGVAFLGEESEDGPAEGSTLRQSDPEGGESGEAAPEAEDAEAEQAPYA